MLVKPLAEPADLLGPATVRPKQVASECVVIALEPNRQHIMRSKQRSERSEINLKAGRHQNDLVASRCMATQRCPLVRAQACSEHVGGEHIGELLHFVDVAARECRMGTDGLQPISIAANNCRMVWRTPSTSCVATGRMPATLRMNGTTQSRRVSVPSTSKAAIRGMVQDLRAMCGDGIECIPEPRPTLGHDRRIVDLNAVHDETEHPKSHPETVVLVCVERSTVEHVGRHDQ